MGEGDYVLSDLRKPQSCAEGPRECGSLHYVYGSDTGRTGNLALLDEKTAIYTVGNAVVLENVFDNHKEYIMGIDECGVGCVGVHPSKKMFAVGGKGAKPNIYIYSYPEKRILKVLKGEAERGYASLDFNHAGTKLASVATAPDYMLTVWDWEQERVMLHTKAFGQDVFSVAFSVDDDNRLTTSGTGHIRFWKIASTFTGLKLQGKIGKFGKVDLSDISAYVELPDGKVISGSETGSLLLWEGGFIKCRFTRADGGRCHEGDITYCYLDRSEKVIITGGSDGYLRFWPFNTIDTAEVDADISMDFVLEPKAELFLGDGCGVKTIVDSGPLDGHRRFLVIVDGRGNQRLLNMNLESTEGKLVDAINTAKGEDGLGNVLAALGDKTLKVFHSGSVTAVDACPVSHLSASCGADGVVNVWDYVKRSRVCSRTFDSGATTLKWAPRHMDSTGRTVMVGFENGMLRTLSLGRGADENKSASISLKACVKAHNGAILSASFNSDGKLLATSGADGFVWVYDSSKMGTHGVTTPLRFFVPKPTTAEDEQLTGELFTATCTSLAWSENEKGLICTCSDGSLIMADVATILDGSLSSNFESFRVHVPLTPRTMSAQVAVVVQAESSSPTKESATANDGDAAPEGEVAGEGSEVEAEPSVTEPQVEIRYESMDAKVDIAAPLLNGSMNGGLLVGANLGTSAQLMELATVSAQEGRELRTGLHSSDGKEYIKTPAVSSIVYSQSRKFVASAAVDGSISVRALDYPTPFVRFAVHSSRATDVAFSFDDSFILSSSTDGSVVVTHFRHELYMEQVPALEADLDAGVYDGVVIKAKDAHASEPPSYLESVTDMAPAECMSSQDGATFVTLADAAPGVEEVDPTSYSIEDAKLKAAEDERKMTADEKKEAMRKKIFSLQQSFAALRKQNEELPRQARLAEEDLLVDPVIVDIFEKEGAKKIEEVHNVCAYESERASRLLQKLQERLMTGLLVEEMPLATFPYVKHGVTQPITCVKSFRTKAMNSALQETLENVRNAVKKEASAVAKAAATLAAQEAAEKDVEAVQGKIQQNLANQQEGLEGAGSQADQAYTAGARRDARKARKAGLRAHAKEKPNENEDDPRDVHAIAMAKETLGDFKLKGASDYRVPADQRVNAEKKRRQLVMLEESTISLRLQFNERFLALRHLKRQMIQVIRSDGERLKEIDVTLGQAGDKEVWLPSIDPMEYPDDRDEVDEQELAAYAKLRETDPWIKTLAPPNSVSTGTKTTVAVDIATGAYDIIKNGTTITNVNVQDPRGKLESGGVMPGVLEEDALGAGPYAVDTRILGSFYSSDAAENKILSALEMQLPTLRLARQSMANFASATSQEASTQRRAAETRVRLERERAALVQKTEETVAIFAQAVEQLRRDRHVTATRLTLAELRVLVMLQEYQLLQTFEEKDNMLHQKQVRCLRERNEIATGSTELQETMSAKSTEISEWKEKHVAIFEEFGELVPAASPFIEVLTKIFKRKIKRRKATEGEEEDEDYESEEDEDEDDEDEEDDDDFEEVCPPGCEASLYDKVIDLREKRLNIEEFIVDNQKIVDDTKKAHDRLRTREKQIDKDLVNTEAEIQQFQLTKQVALNEVDVMVPLRASQVFCFEESGALTGPEKKVTASNGPEEDDLAKAEEERRIAALKQADGRRLVSMMDINSHVVFGHDALEKLQARIGELKSEINAAKVDFKQLHRERASLERQVKVGKGQIEDWTIKCNDLQMLKFGKMIDLDELEAGSDTTRIDEAEAQCAAVEKRFQSSSARLVKQKELLQDKLSEVTIANTALLARISELTESKLGLNRSLNHPGQAMSGDMKLAYMKEIEEKKSIKAYIQVQARELDALRQELAMLRRKDNLTGPIMPPNPPGHSGSLPPIGPK